MNIVILNLITEFPREEQNLREPLPWKRTEFFTSSEVNSEMLTPQQVNSSSSVKKSQYSQNPQGKEMMNHISDVGMLGMWSYPQQPPGMFFWGDMISGRNSGQMGLHYDMGYNHGSSFGAYGQVGQTYNQMKIWMHGMGMDIYGNPAQIGGWGIMGQNHQILDQLQKKKPIILEQTNKRYNGKLKFFDETKGYGFIIMDDDNSDIFCHFDDFFKAGIDLNMLKSAKLGSVIRLSFQCLSYIGRHNKSRKAVDLELLA